jgi:hypothetical protein
MFRDRSTEPNHLEFNKATVNKWPLLKSARLRQQSEEYLDR